MYMFATDKKNKDETHWQNEIPFLQIGVANATPFVKKDKKNKNKIYF